jgi:hypothetical protein
MSRKPSTGATNAQYNAYKNYMLSQRRSAPPIVPPSSVHSYFGTGDPDLEYIEARRVPFLSAEQLEEARRESRRIQNSGSQNKKMLYNAQAALARSEAREAAYQANLGDTVAATNKRYTESDAQTDRNIAVSEKIKRREVPMTIAYSREDYLRDGSRTPILEKDGTPWVFPLAPKNPPLGGTRRMRYNKKQNKQSKHRFRSRVSTSNLRRYSKSKRISRKRLHKRR